MPLYLILGSVGSQESSGVLAVCLQSVCGPSFMLPESFQPSQRAVLWLVSLLILVELWQLAFVRMLFWASLTSHSFWWCGVFLKTPQTLFESSPPHTHTINQCCFVSIFRGWLCFPSQTPFPPLSPHCSVWPLAFSVWEKQGRVNSDKTVVRYSLLHPWLIWVS